MKKLLEKIRKILRDRRTRRFLTRFVSGIAALVVFVTTYALVLPAITMEKQAECGIEAHQHDDSCYTEELICDLQESDGHHHDESCYSTTSVLICAMDEHEHSVGNGCYDDDGNLVCEIQEHQHNDKCYDEVRELTCDIPESEGHTHTEACYEKVLSCGKEVHIHSTSCYKHNPLSDSAVAASTNSAATASTNAGSVSSAGMTLSFGDQTDESDEFEESVYSEESVYNNGSAANDGTAHNDEDVYNNGSEYSDGTAHSDGAVYNNGSDYSDGTDYSDGFDNEGASETGRLSETDRSGDTDRSSETERSGENDGSSETASTGRTSTDNIAEVTYGSENAGTGSTEAANAALTNADNGSTASTSSQAAADQYIPPLDAIDFNTVLNNHTGIYYHPVADGETVEDSFAIPEEEWNRIPNTADNLNTTDNLNTADYTDSAVQTDGVELGKNDLLRVYLSYTIPAGSLNATNPVARYRLPSNLHLTDPQVKAINENINGIAEQYVDMSALEITDPDKYNAYLGLEAVEGTRTPDETVEDYLAEQFPRTDIDAAGTDAADATEYISAVVRVENVYDTDGIYGEKDAYLGQDLIFTFTPYSIEKNQHEYDTTGKPTKAGKEIEGWLTLDLNMGQVDFEEAEITTSIVKAPDADSKAGNDEDNADAHGEDESVNADNTEDDHIEGDSTDGGNIADGHDDNQEDDHDADDYTEDNQNNDADDHTEDTSDAANPAEDEQDRNDHNTDVENNAADNEDDMEAGSAEEEPVSSQGQNQAVTIERTERTAEIVFVEEGWDEKGKEIDQISTTLKVVEETVVEAQDADQGDIQDSDNKEVVADTSTENAGEAGTTSTEETTEPAAEDESAVKKDDTDKNTDQAGTGETAQTAEDSESIVLMPAMSFSDSIKVTTGIPTGIDENAGGTLANAADALPKKAEVSVRVEADEGTFPAGTTMVLKAVSKKDMAALSETVSDTVEKGSDATEEDPASKTDDKQENKENRQNSDSNANTNTNIKTYGFQAVDITFLDKDGKEIEPAKPVRVALTSKVVEQVREEAKESMIADPVVVHVDDEGNAEQMDLVNPEEVEPAQGKSEEELREEAEKAADSGNKADVDTADAGTANDHTNNKENYVEAGAKKAADESAAGDETATNAAVENKEAAEENSTDNFTEIDADRETTVESDNTVENNTEDTNGTVPEEGDASDGNKTAAEAADAGSTLEFPAGSFSVYAIVYTVDFHYDVDGQTYDYSIKGGDTISLKELLPIFNVIADDAETEDVDEVQTFINDIDSVRFSDKSLIKVARIDTDTTAGELKKKIKGETGAEPEYSGELTEDEIAKMDAKELKAVDWALISLKAFDTEETLTVTMKSGEVWTIKVTDVQDPLGIDDRTVSFVYLTNESTGQGVAVQSEKYIYNLAGRSVHYTKINGVEYCDEDATVWIFEYDPDQEAYYISNGYHSDEDEGLYLIFDPNSQSGVDLVRGKSNASPVKIERDDENGYYLISNGNGAYLSYQSQYTSFNCSGDIDNAKLHFCLAEESGTNAPHKATRVSVQDIQPGQDVLIYRRVLQNDYSYKYYAINGDGGTTQVYCNSDSIFWRGNASVEWDIIDSETGYYYFYNPTTQKYLAPKGDGTTLVISQTDINNGTYEMKDVEVSLPGKVFETYGSQISNWDYQEYVTNGIKFNDRNTPPTLSSVSLLNSDEFYFAVRDPIVQKQLTEIDTVDSAALGITIKMYDYSGLTGSTHQDATYGTVIDRLQFMNDLMGNAAWAQGQYTPNMLTRYLEDGGLYPKIAADQRPQSGYAQNVAGNSLRTLFEEGEEYREGGYPYSSPYLYKKVDDLGEVNHLFVQSVYDSSGYLHYSCFENAARLDTDRNEFEVYEQLATNKKDTASYAQRGNFWPLDEIDLTQLGTNNYDHFLNAYGNNSDFPRAKEDVYYVNGGDFPNAFFGMTMEGKFSQTQGAVSTHGDPLVFEFNGDDDMWVYIDKVLILDIGGVHDAFQGKINFQTGLVEVIGPLTNGTRQGETTYIKEQYWQAHRFPDGTEWTNRNDPKQNEFFTNGGTSSDGKLIGTYKEFTTHDFKMFYMERGAGASQLELSFNLPMLQRSQFRVEKRLPETKTGNPIQSQFGDTPFYYVAYVKDNGNYIPCTRQYLISKGLYEVDEDYSVKNGPLYEGEGTIENPVYVDWLGDDPEHPEISLNTNDPNNNLSQPIFIVRPGQTASIPAVDDSLQWYVVEVSPPGNDGSASDNDNVKMLDLFEVSNSDQDDDNNPTPEIQDDYNVGYVSGAKAKDKNANNKEVTIFQRNKVIYTNKPDDKLVKELQIKKIINGTPYNDQDSFEYRIFLEGQDGNLSVYRLGEYYQYDKDGRFVFFKNGNRYTAKKTPTVTTNGDVKTYTFTDVMGDGGISCSDEQRDIPYTENTSINGSLNNVRDGDTIVIKGLMAGTDFYVYERTNPSNMCNDATLIDGKYVFVGTDVVNAYTRNPAANVPKNDFVHSTLYAQPDQNALAELLDSYNASSYERGLAATGAVTEEKNALVFVYNKPHEMTNITIEKEWLDIDGEQRLVNHPDGIKYDVYQFHHEHDWGEWETSTAATSTSEGAETRQCQCEGCSATEARSIDVGRHDFVKLRSVAQTCESEGYDLYICSKNPDHENRVKTSDALGHNWGTPVVIEEATCTTDGFQKYTCQREGCGHILTEVIPATGHNWSSWVLDTREEESDPLTMTRICTNTGCEETETVEISSEDEVEQANAQTEDPGDPNEPEEPSGQGSQHVPVQYLPDALRTLNDPDKGNFVELYQYDGSFATVDNNSTYVTESDGTVVYWSDDYTYPKHDDDGNEYTYYVCETSPESGYKTTYAYYTGVYNSVTDEIDYTATNNSGMHDYGKVHIANKRTIDIDLHKTTDTGAFLAGAVFELWYKEPGSNTAFAKVQVQSPGENVTGETLEPLVQTESITFGTSENDKTFTVPAGGIKINELKAGMYKLVESKAPDGYIIRSNNTYLKVAYDNTQREYIVSLTDDDGNAITQTNASAVSFENDVLSIKNEPGVELPSCGGPGTKLIYLAGALLTLLGAAMLMGRKIRA